MLANSLYNFKHATSKVNLIRLKYLLNKCKKCINLARETLKKHTKTIACIFTMCYNNDIVHGK